jgi:hypothetical protein
MTAKKQSAVPSKLSSVAKELFDSAYELNKESDRLTQAVAPFNEFFKKLNIGISFWFKWIETESNSGNAIGYARVNGKWGIAIKHFENDGPKSAKPDAPKYAEEVWLFDNAPRWMRVDAIAHLEDVVRIGLERTEEMRGKVIRATDKAASIAEHLPKLT